MSLVFLGNIVSVNSSYKGRQKDAFDSSTWKEKILMRKEKEVESDTKTQRSDLKSTWKKTIVTCSSGRQSFGFACGHTQGFLLHGLYFSNLWSKEVCLSSNINAIHDNVTLLFNKNSTCCFQSLLWLKAKILIFVI